MLKLRKTIEKTIECYPSCQYLVLLTILPQMPAFGMSAHIADDFLSKYV